LTKDSANKIQETKFRIEGIKSKIDQLDENKILNNLNDEIFKSNDYSEK